MVIMSQWGEDLYMKADYIEMVKSFIGPGERNYIICLYHAVAGIDGDEIGRYTGERAVEVIQEIAKAIKNGDLVYEMPKE
jgi:hypothetical protein